MLDTEETTNRHKHNKHCGKYHKKSEGFNKMEHPMLSLHTCPHIYVCPMKHTCPIAKEYEKMSTGEKDLGTYRQYYGNMPYHNPAYHSYYDYHPYHHHYPYYLGPYSHYYSYYPNNYNYSYSYNKQEEIREDDTI